jgi:rod shape-determining protein MreB
MVKTIKEKHSTVSDGAPPVTVELPVEGKPTRFEVTDALRESCRKIIPPIVDGLGKLIATFDPEFQHRLKNRVLLAGGGSQIQGLDLAIELEMKERLGDGKVIRIEEPVYGGANGALKIAHDMPAEFWAVVAGVARFRGRRFETRTWNSHAEVLPCAGSASTDRSNSSAVALPS